MPASYFLKHYSEYPMCEKHAIPALIIKAALLN